ncbi:hypothetical protein FK85_17965 [Halorubrum saccharovorum]|uniref:Uncharacterized protein n=1 Tax=Halorubrum saccharovorum TaxID=2248 RepID=A0A081ES60_9EURY|nr:MULTISPECIES: hypothetical protein [Halorubrum]KDS90248.1 hypothetical protein FK85_17965 [Halorubrum saccharovorum]
MTHGRDENASTPDRGAPIDFDRLEIVRERFTTDDRFARIEAHPTFAPERLQCVYNRQLYPGSVQAARLEVVWYQNGDFSIHYHEDHGTSEYDHRWDRHPSDHNTRDHVHPGPDAPTPGENASHPTDWRDVLSMALSEVDDRQRAFWEP